MYRIRTLLILNILLLGTLSPSLSSAQSEFRFVETDLVSLQNGRTPVFRDVVATPDGGAIVLYSSENMSREFAERNRGPLLPTLGIMKIGRGGEIEWGRFVDDLRELRPHFIIQDPDLNYIVGATLFSRTTGAAMTRPTFLRFGPLGSLLDAWTLPAEISGDPIDASFDGDEITVLIEHESSAILARSDFRRPDEVRAWTVGDAAGGSFHPHAIARDSTGRDVIVGYLRTADERRPVQGGIVLLGSEGEVVGGGNLQGEGITAIHDVEVSPKGEVYLLATSATTPTSSVDRVDTTAEGFSLSSQSFPTIVRLADDLSVDTSIRVVHNRFHLTGSNLEFRADGSLVVFGREERSTEGDAEGNGRFASGGALILFSGDLDTLGTVPIGRPDDPTSDQIEGDPYTTIDHAGLINPSGYPRIESIALATDEGILMVGSDIRGVPVLLHYSETGPFSCMQSAPFQSSFVATGDRLRPRQFHSTLIGSLLVEYLSAELRRDTLRLITPCQMMPGEIRGTDPAGIDLILTPNFIRKGELLEVEVIINRQSVRSYQIEAVDPESGDREVLISREIATPYNETVSLPTASLAPGPYLLVLHAGDNERIVRMEVQP